MNKKVEIKMKVPAEALKGTMKKKFIYKKPVITNVKKHYNINICKAQKTL